MDIFSIIGYVVLGLMAVLLVVLTILIVFRKKLIMKKLFMDGKRGDRSAQLAIGGYYFSQNPPDVENGVVWLTKAAESGSCEAQTVLGTMYGDGKLVPQNKEESVKWFLQGAMNGSVFAQKTIAGVYHFTIGLDKKTAYAWYMAAATQGDSHSKEMAEKLMNEFSDDDREIAIATGEDYITKYASDMDKLKGAKGVF